MKAIFQYIDYRKYLADFYLEQKEKSRHFSYRYFAQKTGINSPSFLKHVIDGKRDLTRPVIEKFSVALKLTAKEASYFRNLVLFNQSKTSAEKQEHYTILQAMAGHVHESVLGSDQYDYFTNWYTPVVRELLCLRNFGDDYKKIASLMNPEILPSEVKTAIKLLLRLKLIERKSDGAYRQINTAISADNAVMSMAVRSFTKNMIDHSKAALDLIDKTQRHISGMTIGISPETFAVLAAEITAFKDRVKVIVNHDTSSSRVYQLNMSLFPVSEDVSILEKAKDGGP